MQSSPSLKPTAQVTRAAVLLAGVILSVQAAFGGIKSERLLASILRETPEATLVQSGQQMKVAEAMAAELQDAQTFWGVGSSMEPLYAAETAIVVQSIKFSELRKGMTVVYINRRGHMVAHSLTGDIPKGWIAQGINNDKEDEELVTRKNLVGVIVQAYSAMHTDYRTTLTKTLVAKGKLVLASNRG